MARTQRQIAAISMALVAPAQTWAAPASTATQSPAVPTRQGDAAVFIDQRTGFTLVTHKARIAEREPLASQIRANQRSARDGGEQVDPSRIGSANFRRATYLRSIMSAEARYALPTGLLDALIWTESRYNPFAISNTGAIGLGQLMPGTARDMGVCNRLDPRANIEGAARYLRLLINRFGLIHLALAAYNAGPSAVEHAGGIPLNGQTPAYVQDVVRRWIASK